MINIDLILSYWIFLWFLLFCFGLIKYNPFLLLCLGLLFSFYEIYYLISKKASKYNIIKFTFINIILKSIPVIILFLMNKNKCNMNDLLFSIVFVSIYLLYLHFNNTNIIEIYNRILYGLIYDNNNNDYYKTISSKLYDKFFIMIKNINDNNF